MNIDVNISKKFFNKVYLPFLIPSTRYNVFYGGAGSGKSHFIAQKKVFNHLSQNKKKTLVIRKVAKTLRFSVFQLINDIISQWKLKPLFKTNKTDMNITCENGNQFIFLGLDDVEKLKSITGITDIWIEEASEISQKEFQQLDLRLRGKTSFLKTIDLSFNPIDSQHWLKKYFFDNKDDDFTIVHTTYKDNDFIDDNYKQTLMKLKKRDIEYYKIYALGVWGLLKGQIFTNWEIQDLTWLKNENHDWDYGQDFGYTNHPSAFCKSLTKENEKIIYFVDEFYGYGMSNEAIAKKQKEYGVGEDIVWCDKAEPKSIDRLKELGINAIGADKPQGSVKVGIDYLKDYKIIVDESCINFINELKLYKWLEKKDGTILNEPLKENDHLCDALRYSKFHKIVDETSKFVKIDNFYLH